MSNNNYKIYFSSDLSERERACFETGIKLGALYHILSGIPISSNENVIKSENNLIYNILIDTKDFQETIFRKEIFKKAKTVIWMNNFTPIDKNIKMMKNVRTLVISANSLICQNIIENITFKTFKKNIITTEFTGISKLHISQMPFYYIKFVYVRGRWISKEKRNI